MNSQYNTITEKISYLTAKLSIAACYLGLIYAIWISSDALPHDITGIGIVYTVALFILGTFLAPIVIGAGIALLLSLLSTILVRRLSPTLLALNLLIAPTLSFMVAVRAPFYAASWDPFGLLTRNSSPAAINCTKPKISFTLGYNDRLDDNAKAELCRCLGTSLSTTTQNLLEGSNEPNSSMSGETIEGVKFEFATALKQCGIDF